MRALHAGSRAVVRTGRYAPRCTYPSKARHISSISVNGRDYRRPAPNRISVGICLDGSAQEYVDAACRAGKMPHWQRILANDTMGTTRGSQGHWGLVAGVMPSLTNPNNMAIVTGTPPNVNGICGNYYFDTEAGQEVMMNDPSMLRANTVLSALNDNGTKVRVITAKDKLRRMLSHGLPAASSLNTICFSAEKEHEMSAEAAAAVNTLLDAVGGRPASLQKAPTIYDPEISIYMLRMGALLAQADASRMQSHPQDYQAGAFYYLSTTDYVQHKYAPDMPEALDFYGKVDSVLGDLDAIGANVALTADHGMNDKTKFDGSPQVVFVETELRDHLTKFSGRSPSDVNVRVILPITDPYVVHHGALGGYATVYLAPELVDEARAFLRSRRGVYSCLSRMEAAKAFELPEDRIGDIVIVGDRETVFGRTPEFHDLSGVQRLRSHGAIDESYVPLFVNRPLQVSYARKLTQGLGRNFDLFDFLLNGIEQ